jgi:hypothetical protein
MNQLMEEEIKQKKIKKNNKGSWTKKSHYRRRTEACKTRQITKKIRLEKEEEDRLNDWKKQKTKKK